MLTVLKNNASAADFYGKLRYTIDAISPSVSEEEAAHEILSKVVDPAACARAEEISAALRAGKVPEELLAAVSTAAATRVGTVGSQVSVAAASAAAGAGI